MNDILGRIASIYYGEAPNFVRIENSNVPIYGSGGIYGWAKQACYEGPGIIVARKGSLGVPYLVTTPFWPSDTTYAVIPKRGIDVRWLYYYLLLFDLSRLNEATGVPSISRDRLAKIHIEYPSIEIQIQIADILMTIDSAITQTETFIKKYEQIKAGMMHDLFTRGIMENGELRPTESVARYLYKDSLFGPIPNEWKIMTIEDLFDCQLGKMLNKFAKTGKNMAKYLGNRAVQWDYVDINSLEDMNFTPEEREKYSLHKGDLLVCEGGDVGRTAMWREEAKECYYQKAIHRLRAKNESVSPNFFLRFMKYAYMRGLFNEFTSKSSIAHLTMEKLKTIEVFLPSLPEQEGIADRMDAIDKVIQRESNLRNKQIMLKQSLMQDLLVKKAAKISV